MKDPLKKGVKEAVKECKCIELIKKELKENGAKEVFALSIAD